jgi:hypothetical protein
VGRIVVDASIVDLDGLTFERASVTPPVISAFGKLSANCSTGSGRSRPFDKAASGVRQSVQALTDCDPVVTPCSAAPSGPAIVTICALRLDYLCGSVEEQEREAGLTRNDYFSLWRGLGYAESVEDA